MKPFDVQLTGNDYNEIMIFDEQNGGLIPPDPSKHEISVIVKPKTKSTNNINEQYKNNKRAKSNERFVFAKMEPETRFCPDLDFATLWRLTVLATYSSYSVDGTDGYLTNDLPTKAQKPITPKEMQNILKLTKKTFDRFMNNICHITSNGEVKRDCYDTNGQIKNNIVNYLYPINDGKWYLNRDYFLRGTLVKGQQSYVNRIFCDTVRKLHRVAKQGQHKQLGMILSLMPYINQRWNVICANPFEDDPERIIPLNARDICKVLGLSTHNAEVTIGKVSNDRKLYGRLYKTLLDIELPINEKQQLFCALQVTKYDAAIIVNPNFIFLGNEKQKQMIIDANRGFVNPNRLCQ